jgi:ferredoxin-NADP reductase
MGTLATCIQRGCTTVEALAKETGATTVCGACTPRVAAMVGVKVDVPARVEKVLEVTPSIRSFRMVPVETDGEEGAGDGAPDPEIMGPALPGQHIVVSARIDGEWVSRPYTLTSPADERAYREITVRRDPDGRFSRWLFDHRRDDDELRISKPRGEFFVRPDESGPLVFLVGGIGCTPALGTVRSLATDARNLRIHIDYSVRTVDDIAYRSELELIASTHPNVTVRFRVDGDGDPLGPSAIARYLDELRGAQFLICGPKGYEECARNLLPEAQVPSDRVRVETFTPAPRVILAPRSRRDDMIRAIGATLLLGYVVQALMGLNWPWLGNLQADETYRRWSGATLSLFLLAQLVLPALRLRERFRAAARAYPWHRWLGALAPLFFYAHAQRPGFGYLFVLGVVYLLNTGIGLADKTIVRDPKRRERYGLIWLIPHVALSLLIVGLVFFHLFVVFAYKGVAQ